MERKRKLGRGRGRKWEELGEDEDEEGRGRKGKGRKERGRKENGKEEEKMGRKEGGGRTELRNKTSEEVNLFERKASEAQERHGSSDPLSLQLSTSNCYRGNTWQCDNWHVSSWSDPCPSLNATRSMFLQNASKDHEGTMRCSAGPRLSFACRTLPLGGTGSF